MEENEKVKGIQICKNWIIGSDSMSVVLYEFGEKFNNKTKTESFGLKKTTYHMTLEQSLNHILNKEVCNCEFNDLKELVDRVKEVRKTIADFRKITKVVGNDTIEEVE